MDMIHIREMPDDQLTAMLNDLGKSIGPITPATRTLYENKLFKRLHLGLDDEKTHSLRDPLDGIPDGHNLHTVSSSTSMSTTGTSQTHVTVRDSVNCVPNSKDGDKLDTLGLEHLSYFGIQLPQEHRTADICCVYTDKVEALTMMKKYSGSRFKVFKSREEAKQFAAQGATLLSDQACSSPQPCMMPSSKELAKATSVSEGSAFRGPKPQDLVKLRKMIEAGEVDQVKELVWSNPRYLVSSGDTPTVLQEGFRYNAMHVCACKNKSNVARLILDTVEDPAFLHLLYPEDSTDCQWHRINFLADLYLNTPDKGLCESPLHFACKFGHHEMVDVLTSHPKIDKTRKNKYGELPQEVVCTRAKAGGEEMKESILSLLEDRYYVPLLRPDDNTWPACIAYPWSPSADGGKIKVSQAEKHKLLVPDPTSPTEAPLAIKAYAGPMSPSQASRFRKEWVTPPSRSPQDRRKFAEIRRGDSEKGFERIGRNIAHELGIPWQEYWDFLDSFVDMSCEDGLQKLEDHLQKQKGIIVRDALLEKDMEFVNTNFRCLKLNESLDNSDSVQGASIMDNKKYNDSNVSEMEDEDTGEERVDELCDALPLANSMASARTKSIHTNNLDKTNKCDRTESSATYSVNWDRVGSSGANTTYAGSWNTVRPIGFNQTLLDNTASKSSTVEDEQYGDNVEDHETRSSGGSTSSNDSSFHTACDDLEMDMLETSYLASTQPTSTPVRVFLFGSEPTKSDVDVLRAVEHLSDVTPESYPTVALWRDQLLAYSEQARNSLSTPVRINTPQKQPLLLNNRSIFMESPSFTDSSGMTTDSDSSFDSSTVHIRENLMQSFSAAR